MLLLPLLLAGLTTAVVERERPKRVKEFIARSGLGAQAAQKKAGRWDWIRSTYGQAAVDGIVTAATWHGIPLEGEGAKVYERVWPWVARELARGRVGETELQAFSLWDLPWWVESLGVDLGPLVFYEARLRMDDWVFRMEEARITPLLLRQGLPVPLREQEEILGPVARWFRERMLRGDAGIVPELRWLADWVRGAQVSADALRTYSVTRATEASAAHHGQPPTDQGAWLNWKARVEEMRTRGWRPLPGEVIRRWDSGYSLHVLTTQEELTDESAVMGHCVGWTSQDYAGKVARGDIWIWSMRQPDGFPVITLEVTRGYRYGTLEGAGVKAFPQIWGPGNTQVHPAYQGLVFDVVRPYFSYIPLYLREALLGLYAQRGTPAWQEVLRDQQLLLMVAKKEGPREDTRQAASAVPATALAYATEVDKGPHPETRRGVLSDARLTWLYVIQVDKEPTPETIPVILGDYTFGCVAVQKFPALKPLFFDLLMQQGDPESLYTWVFREGSGPNRPDLVAVQPKICASPFFALLLAAEIQKAPDALSRASAYRHPVTAWLYDQFVPNAKSDAGRTAACGAMEPAALYAWSVDEAPSDEVTAALLQAPSMEDPAWTERDLLPDRDTIQRMMDHSLVREIPDQIFRSLLGARAIWPDIYLRYFLLCAKNKAPLDATMLARVQRGANAGGIHGEDTILPILAWIHRPVLVDPAWRPGIRTKTFLPRVWRGRDETYELLRRGQRDVWAEMESLRNVFLPPTELQEALRQLLRIPTMRKAWTDEAQSALIVATEYDKGLRPDTEKALSNSDHTLKDYLAAVTTGYTSWPGALRRKLGEFGISTEQIGGWRSATYTPEETSRGGWGRSSSRRGKAEKDYFTNIVGPWIMLQVSAMVEVARFWARSKNKAVQREVAGYIWEMEQWAGVGPSYEGGCSPPPEAAVSFFRRFDPTWLSWIHEGVFSGRRPDKPERILTVLSEGEKAVTAKARGYLGVLNRCGEGGTMRIPPLSENNRYAAALRPGAEDVPASPLYTDLAQWYAALTPQKRRWLIDRTDATLSSKGADVRGLLPYLGGVFVAATVHDAEKAYGSPLVVEVTLHRTPVAHLLPWTTPNGAVGWMVIYPVFRGYGVISPEARETLLYKSNLVYRLNRDLK